MQAENSTLEINGRVHSTLTLGHQKNASPVHFSGANGFPVRCYEQFLARFASNYRVTAADCRATIAGIAPPTRGFDLHNFADDLIQILETMHDQPVIAMGHSFGAHVSLIAAIKRPDLFSHLVLIEPASLPSGTLDKVYKHLPRFVLDRMLPMIPKTRARQRVWIDRQPFLDRYRRHKTFQHMTDAAFNDYAEYGLRERSDGQLELVFDPQWEAHIFSKVEFVWKNLRKVRVPALFIRAEHSNLYSHELFIQENRNLPHNVDAVEIDNTHHLLPLEHPDNCEQAIRAWLSSRQ